MRLVLIGDIHAYRLAVPPWHLLGKAFFGQANLWWRRRHRFNLALLPEVISRAAGLHPDLVLLSGDLTTTAYRGEFTDIAAALQPLLANAPTIAIPGNHDRYTIASILNRNFERALLGAAPKAYPFLLALDELVPLSSKSEIRNQKLEILPPARWHLLALNSAMPSFTSRGRLGQRQLAAAATELKTLSAADGLIVLCHYSLGKPPPFPPSPWHHLLADAPALLTLLERFPGRVIYIHGHVHRPWIWPRTEPGLERILDVNAGAPCCVGPDFPSGQGFWEIDLPAEPRAPIQLLHHQPSASGPPDSTLQWKIEPTTVGFPV